MKYQDNKELARNDRGVVITAGRAGWVAGMRWTQSDTGTGPLARLRMKSTHFLNSGGGPDRVTGLVSPGKSDISASFILWRRHFFRVLVAVATVRTVSMKRDGCFWRLSVGE
jgi:hypothetical protein